MLLECPNCTITFEGEILRDYQIVNPDDPLEAFKYTFSKCPKCESPILTEQEREIDFDAVYWGNPKVLYPQTDFHINPVIPDKLRESLLESIQCYRAKSYTATTIMCRRTIEGFCTIKGIKERNLTLSIAKLKAEGIINEQLFEWANELRLLGNEAAHNIEIGFTSTYLISPIHLKTNSKNSRTEETGIQKRHRRFPCDLIILNITSPPAL